MSDAKSKIAKALMKDPEWEYGEILPMATRKGEREWAIPDYLRAPLQSWVKLMDSMGTGQIQTHEGTEELMPDILNILPLPAAAGAAGVPKSALGMFGGRLAATADKTALKQAEEMAAAGLPREEIWKATGWFQGVDGKWRFEIDDRMSGALADPHVSMAGQNGKGVPIRERMLHGDYFNAYPEAADIKVQAAKSALNNGEIGAMYYPPREGHGGYIPYQADSPDNGRSVLLHELQHDAQNREGFSPGAELGNADYRRAAGEVEARTVQKRKDMTKSERQARPPWQDYDVPEHEQIVRALLGKP